MSLAKLMTFPHSLNGHQANDLLHGGTERMFIPLNAASNCASISRSTNLLP
jgi:hypothetical protein